MYTHTHTPTDPPFTKYFTFLPKTKNYWIPLDFVTFNKNFIYVSIFISLLVSFSLAATGLSLPFHSPSSLLAAIKLGKYFMRLVLFALLFLLLSLHAVSFSIFHFLTHSKKEEKKKNSKFQRASPVPLVGNFCHFSSFFFRFPVFVWL